MATAGPKLLVMVLAFGAVTSVIALSPNALSIALGVAVVGTCIVAAAIVVVFALGLVRDANKWH
jgi:hypothetical protein